MDWNAQLLLRKRRIPPPPPPPKKKSIEVNCLINSLLASFTRCIKKWTPENCSIIGKEAADNFSSFSFDGSQTILSFAGEGKKYNWSAKWAAQSPHFNYHKMKSRSHQHTLCHFVSSYKKRILIVSYYFKYVELKLQLSY